MTFTLPGDTMSIRASIISFFIRRTLKPQLAVLDDVPAFRERMKGSGMSPAVPDRVSVVPVTINGVPCEWLTTDTTDQNRVLMYLHGGGYVFGGLDSHRDLGWRLAEASGMRVLMVDYRLAPENPFPAAVEDATQCYRWLIDEGFDPGKMVVGGDSAGGGLAVASLVNLKNLGVPMPNGMILLSPWVDVSVSGDSVEKNEDSDAMLSRAALEKFAGFYMDGRDRRAPLASPLFADLKGLPTTLIHVGGTEVLLSDAQRLADKLHGFSVEAALEVWPKMPHVFQLFAARVPEGKQSIVKLAEFLKQRTSVA